MPNHKLSVSQCEIPTLLQFPLLSALSDKLEVDYKDDSIDDEGTIPYRGEST